MPGRNEREPMLLDKRKCILKLGRSVRLLGATLILFCAFAGTARAQWHAGRLPQIEMSGNYSFIRARAANAGQSFNLNGGGAAFAYAHNAHFSTLVDVGAYHFIAFLPVPHTTLYTYLFHPALPYSAPRA